MSDQNESRPFARVLKTGGDGLAHRLAERPRFSLLQVVVEVGIRVSVGLSGIFHSDAMTLGTPASMKARDRPRSPSAAIRLEERDPEWIFVA